MVKYTPAPQDLSRLNPIQRYMQKGSLDWSDWLRLGAVVLAYWLLRPYIQRVAKKLSGEELQEGEAQTEAYKERRAAAAVGANDIRSGKKKEESKTLGQVLDEGVDGFVASSGAAVSSADGQDMEVKNRKAKKSKGVSFAPEKSELERTLDWEDESEFDPRRESIHTDREEVASGDIKQWMDKWTS